MSAQAQAVFVSDVHLSTGHPEITRLFFAFIDRIAEGTMRTRRLYILGDLFDYWPGDDALDEAFNQSVVQRLRRLVEQGVAVYFMHGNRDVLIGARFAEATGARLLDDPTEVAFDTGTLLLSHGDALCTDDTDYQAFRSMVREPAWQQHFLAKPLAERHAIIGGMRLQSDQAKQQKTSDIMDVNAQAVAQLFRQGSTRVMIHGHTHRPAHHRLNVDGRPCERWVLTDWDGSSDPPRGGGLWLDEEGLRPIGLVF